MLKYLTDIRLAILFLVIGAAGLALSLTVAYSLLLAQAAATVLLAAVVYLLVRLANRNVGEEEDEGESAGASSNVLRLLDIVFWGLITAGLLLLSQGAGARPLAFLLVVSAAAAILAVQIWRGRGAAYSLFKILVIAVLLRASAYYQFPGTAGYDAFAEINNAAQLVANGHNGTFMGNYQYYPIANYFTAAASYLTGLGLRDSYFVLGVAEAISAVFVFLVGRRFFGERTGLLAALMVAVLDWHILWGFYIKAMSLGITLVALSLFLVLAPPGKRKVLCRVIGLLVMALVILTHPFAAAVLAVVLAVAWLLWVVLKPGIAPYLEKQAVTFSLVALFVCATLAYWMYVSGFDHYVADAISYALSVDAANLVVASVPMSVAEDIWVRLPTFLLIFLAAIGCLACFNIRRMGQETLSRAWLAALCGVMVIINFAIFYLPQTGPLVRERWFVFVGLLLAIPAAYGVREITGRVGAAGAIGAFTVVLMFSGVMTTSYIASPGRVVSFGPANNLAATASEITAADSLALVSAAGGEKVYADHYYSQVFLYDAGLPREEVVDFSEMYSDEMEAFDGLLALRMDNIQVASMWEEIIMDEARYQALLEDPQSSLVYDCGTVRAFRR